jgi:esterase/lipase superfamily enzyme
MKIIEWKALIEVLIENAPIIVFALWILLQFSTRFNFLKNYKEIKAYRFVAPKDEPGGEITIFYGTNRNKTQDSRLNNIYGSDLSTLQLGSCTISIPEGHKIGEIERPRKILLWSRREDVNKDIVLTSIFEDNEKDFYNWLKKNAANTENKSALVFVHGFNTSFVEAAWRTGQIAYDLPFNGVTGFFSWPSTGDTIDYGRDIERADSSITNLVTFIKDIIQKTDVEQLHFVAHSMGNRVLTRALNVLVGDPSFSDKINRISQIILYIHPIKIKLLSLLKNCVRVCAGLDWLVKIFI